MSISPPLGQSCPTVQNAPHTLGPNGICATQKNKPQPPAVSHQPIRPSTQRVRSAKKKKKLKPHLARVQDDQAADHDRAPALDSDRVARLAEREAGPAVGAQDGRPVGVSVRQPFARRLGLRGVRDLAVRRVRPHEEVETVQEGRPRVRLGERERAAARVRPASRRGCDAGRRRGRWRGQAGGRVARHLGALGGTAGKFGAGITAMAMKAS